jgi:copper(I)-binding protein
MTRLVPLSAIAAVLLAVSAAAGAQVRIDHPWARPTVAAQTSTDVYLSITSVGGGRLVEASSPLAASAEVHEMKMDGDVMRMRRIDALPLPAGRPVELKPGGYHLMLFGLKAPVKAGEAVPVKLVVEDAKGRRETVDVKAVAHADAP